MTRSLRAAALIVAVALLCAPASGQEAPAAAPGLSADELNRELNNPVSSVWSLTFQHNIIELKNTGGNLPEWDNHDTEWLYNLNFQPVLPLPLTESWNLISRPVLSVFLDKPVFDQTRFEGKSGLGDTTFFSLLAPAKPRWKNFLWGVGPTLIFPTASPEILGQEKWQAGAAAVALYLSDRWVVGVLPQHWWSYAGDGGAPSVSFTNLQYFIQRLFPGGWQVGMGPNLTVDWKADHDNAVTFPVGLGFGKLLHFGKLPVKLVLEADYAVVHPEDIGQRWLLRFVMTPVLPALVKNPILGF